MTKRTKLLLVPAALLLGVAVVVVLVPLLVRGPLAERVRVQLDDAVSARVRWGGMSVSLLRDFPDVTLSVRDLTVVGTGDFDGDTLASAADLRVVLEAWSVVRGLRRKGPVVVQAIRLDEPALRLRVLQDGTASWDLLKRRAAADSGSTVRGGGASKALGVELRSFRLTGGTVEVDDQPARLRASLEGLDYALSGDLSRERVVLRTEAHAVRTSMSFAGVPYLSQATVDLDAGIDADLARKRFTFQDNELRINDLPLRFQGEAVGSDEGTTLDVTFSAPRTEFAHILSLVPVVYAHDFETLQTSGGFSLEGGIHGTWGAGTLPAFDVRAVVDAGSFRYPDLPLPARDISAELEVSNPGGDADSTVVRLRRFHVVIGDQPLDASLTLRTPVSDPDVDARVEGTVDLSALARTVKMDAVQELSGTVTADASMRARRSDLESRQYDRVSASGSVSAKDVSVRAAALRQPVDVEEARIQLAPRRAELRSFRARLGSSDVRADGWIDNGLGFLLYGEPLHGSMTFASRRFVLDEWKSDDPTLQVIPVPANLDLALNGTVDTLTYGTLRMVDARGGVDVKDQRLTLNDFGLKTLGGRVELKGDYDTSDPARPTFAMNLALDSLDVAGAADAFLTVRTLAPIARYARGTFSSDLELSGNLDADMRPSFDALSGQGSLLTSRIAVEDFPLLQKLAGALEVPRLANPTFEAIRSSMEIRDGRLHVRPFRVGVGNVRMSVEGSNGVDQSLDYALGLSLPRASLGDASTRIVEGLASRAGRVGIDLQSADTLRVTVRATGTVTDPALDLGFGQAVAG
ncbi:MAG: AsmA-like C-terminal region-containing protein, partial [Gemmatimonadota bacterium]